MASQYLGYLLGVNVSCSVHNLGVMELGLHNNADLFVKRKRRGLEALKKNLGAGHLHVHAAHSTHTAHASHSAWG
jgi:hypothetical protein